ncbi:MAG: flavodoxin family protein [Syntrophales bacterium]|nr:flavodoxin family protein [Syntrophales bacterium]
MKVVCVLGSPRSKGNSSFLARRICDRVRSSGAKVKIFSLNKISYRGCQGCMACKDKLERCGVDDDLSQVLEAVRLSDCLILATPVYYGDVSSQLKAFIDRTFSFLKPDFPSNPMPSRLAPGKKMVFILTQGQPDEDQFADIFPRYDSFFRLYGFSTTLIRVCGVFNPGDVENHPEALQWADETAERLIKS